MADPKTKPTAASVDGFIAADPNDRRRADAGALRDLLAELTGETPLMWGPSIIGYGRYRGPTGDWPVIGFSPRTANLVLYLAPDAENRTDLLARLGKHKIGKTCLYIGKLADADAGVLRELCADSVAGVRQRHPTG
jgi:hypothetical protein